MSKFKNVQGISGITMFTKLHCFCPLGKDWYTNNMEIYVIPDDTIPDYIEVEQEFKNNIEGKELLIEDAVSAVTDILKKYEPVYINVVSEVDDATHLKVKVNKEYSK